MGFGAGGAVDGACGCGGFGNYAYILFLILILLFFGTSYGWW